MDHASLNQIVENVQSRLDAQGAELGVTFDYADYYDNAQGDQSVLSQIGANMVADGVDIVVAVASPQRLGDDERPGGHRHPPGLCRRHRPGDLRPGRQHGRPGAA